MNRPNRFKNVMLYLIAFNLLMVFAIISTYNYFPLRKLGSFENKDDRASDCPYYFTLQSLLAGYPLLSSDKANLTFIKKSLFKFEDQMSATQLSPAILTKYKIPFQNALRSLNVTSLRDISSETALLAAAKKVSPIIDNYHLDSSVYCQNVYYDWENHMRRLLRYNLNGLYDLKPNKYSRILMSTNTDWITGSSSSHFIINQTETLDTRFMAGLPMLSALYILPKNDYSQSGNYASPGNWRYFNPSLLQDSTIRKVMDIAGADIFTFFQNDLGKKKLADTAVLNSTINPRFGNLFVSLVNNRSYGFAYFANQITYADPAEIQGYEKSIKHYFQRRDNPALFTQQTNILYSKLLQLKNKHDVILESLPSDQQLGSGNITINGIVGERAFFSTDCAGKQCMFVFNVGASNGWHAYVNGHNSEIIRANFAFMATPVNSGHGTVWFIYSSTAQLLSYFVSILTLLAIVVISATPGQRLDRLAI